MVDAVAKRDVPVVQACGLIFAAVYIILNMFADILAILSNPRLQAPRSERACLRPQRSRSPPGSA